MMSGLLQSEIKEDILKTDFVCFGRTFQRLNRALHFVEVPFVPIIRMAFAYIHLDAGR